MKHWSTAEGAPFPQGVTWIEAEKAYNFSLYTKHAEAVTLCFYGREDSAAAC